MAKAKVTPTCPVPEDPIAALQFAIRTRRQFQQAELRLANQIWALEHPGGRRDPRESDTLKKGVDSPAIAELQIHLDAIAAKRKHWEKIATGLAKQHPLWSAWAERVRGIGALSFGQIIAEIGDPRSYGNPAKIWKRMGLAVIDGRAQRRVKGAAGIEHGFSPRRRALMAVVADNLVKLNKDGYRSLYLERKAYETERHPELKLIARDRRAKRYMAKRLLRDLWAQARAA